VFIAIGIVWVVIQGVITEGVEDIEYEKKCLEIDLEVTKIVCWDDIIYQDGVCNISIARNAGGKDFAGVKIIFDKEGVVTDVTERSIEIEQLQTKTLYFVEPDTTQQLIKENTKVIPYFLSPTGEKIIC
jgi:hypothetical protein